MNGRQLVRSSELLTVVVVRWLIRKDQKRGYQATAMSHGRAYALPAMGIVKMLQQPQYREVMKASVRKIALLRCARLLMSFNRTVKEACKVRRLFSWSNIAKCQGCLFCIRMDERQVFHARPYSAPMRLHMMRQAPSEHCCHRACVVQDVRSPTNPTSFSTCTLNMMKALSYVDRSAFPKVMSVIGCYYMLQKFGNLEREAVKVNIMRSALDHA